MTKLAGLSGSAHYKQTFVFVCDQTTQAGVSRSLHGNGALRAVFWHAVQTWIFLGEKSRTRISTGVDQFIDFC